MKVYVTLYNNVSHSATIIHKTVDQFKSGYILFSFYCPLIPWIFKKHNIEINDFSSLCFNDEYLSHVNLIRVNDHEINLNMLNINVQQPISMDSFINVPCENHKKLNCKKITVYSGLKKAFLLHGNFKYVCETYYQDLNTRNQITYNIFNNKKQGLMQIYICIPKFTEAFHNIIQG